MYCIFYAYRYTPQTLELDHKMKPFIPDFIPSVGDIDAFIKVKYGSGALSKGRLKSRGRRCIGGVSILGING